MPILDSVRNALGLKNPSVTGAVAHTLNIAPAIIVEEKLGMLRVAGFKYFSRPIGHTPGRVLLSAAKHEQSRLDWRKLSLPAVEA